MKIGLALSGGGVLGVAHIGVLEELEKHQIKINSITGTSAGAIIGALFASGGVEMVNNFIAELEKAGLFNPKKLILKPIPDLIFETVRKTLRKFLPEKFYDLNIRYSCVATNYSNGETEVLSSGNLVDAIMASSAFPGIFPAQEINGKSLMDGGMSMNFPASLLKGKVNFIIGSSLYDVPLLAKYDKVGVNPNRFDSARRSVDIMQKKMAQYEQKYCDFCFTPPIETFNWFNLDKMPAIRKIGREYATEKIGSLLVAIEKRETSKGFWRGLFR